MRFSGSAVIFVVVVSGVVVVVGYVSARCMISGSVRYLCCRSNVSKSASCTPLVVVGGLLVVVLVDVVKVKTSSSPLTI